MTIVVFEDNDDKYAVILGELVSKGISESHVTRIDNVAQAIQISNGKVDLCIIDIRMPGVSGGSTRSTGTELLEILNYAGMRPVPVLAITAYPDEARSLQEAFSSRGCIIYDYDEKNIWSQALDVYLAQARSRQRFDFLIITALKEERDAFLNFPTLGVISKIHSGLDIWEVTLAGHQGAIILLPRMGLVNAAVITAQAIERCAPSVVAMSGICAGLASSVELGQLLVTDMVWEYQSGKWLNEVFEAEPYQVTVKPETSLVLAKLMEQPDLINNLERSFASKFRPPKVSDAKLANFASGSAVIASDKRLASVKEQHRKVTGLDMELYGFHRAVELSSSSVRAFSAKVVVDKANVAKDDSLHEYGAALSAAFVVEALKVLLISS
jgi:adenosylhomocysteine nucleosidase